jgi:Protein of unknown function (DUF1524)
VNSKAGTKPFADKVDIYKSVNGLHHVNRVRKLKDWNLSALEKRERELLKFAQDQWW